MKRAAFDPREAVESMLWAFRTRAVGLFEPTRPNEYREYYKGLFGILYARPTKHVSRLLSVDREVLVLVTSFEDLQARTVQLAIDIIDGSEGRLERTVGIIVHRDPSGNGKLRNWGREQGLTVIPLFMPDYDLPTGPTLERSLLSEFYSHDPFDVTGPVSDDHQFYGRRDEAQDLARHLQKGQVRACLGIRKIGKTSIIHRVLYVAQDFHDCFGVMVDCSKDVVWQMSAPQLLQAIAEAVRRAYTAQDFCSEVVGTEHSPSVGKAYEEMVTVLRSAPGPVILFFDEVDYITPGSPTAPHWEDDFNTFWRNLRAVYQEIARTPMVLSVLVSGVSSKWFREESIGGVENAALAFIPEEYLSPLSGPASSAMVKSIGRTSGLLFDDAAAAALAGACSHVPYWIRKAGSYIHRRVDLEGRPSRVTEEAVVSLTKAFIQNEGAAIAEVALSHLFRVYPELQPVAAACMNGVAEGQPRHLLAALENYGVINGVGQGMRVTGSLMEAGLALCLERRDGARLGQVDPPDSPDPIKFATLDDWAAELALIGARRNKLEKRLRGIVVNFIRFDSLQNKSRGGLADRITRVIDDQRRAKVQHLSPDEAVERFYWTDLVRLIEKEWPLFAPVFSDRAKFSLHATVVNQRFDAHAKDVDRADIADYRRSLGWLEEAISRV